MNSRRIALASFSANSLSENITSGEVNALLITVEGVTATTPADVETTIQEIFEEMDLEVTRTLPDGKTVQIVKNLNADDFRVISNLRGGYMTATNGVFIDLGRHVLGGASRLDIVADWSDADSANYGAGYDVGSAQVGLYAVKKYKGVAPQAMIYAGSDQVATTHTHAIEVPNIVFGVFKDGTLSEAVVTVNGNQSTLHAPVVTAYSAAMYSHEDESVDPPYVVYDADHHVGRRQTPDLRLTTTAAAGRLVQIGFAGKG